jgi:hypothetical protein
MKVEMTDDYLILLCIDVILCVSLKDIDDANDITKGSYIEKLHDTPQIPVKLINMKELFDTDTIDQGLTIDTISQNQVNLTERVKNLKNVI